MGLIEDSMVLDLGTALVEVNRTVVNKLRPLKWRQFITPSSANSAAEFIEMRKRIDYADIRPMGPQDSKFPIAYEKKTSTRLPVFEFAAGLRIHDDELERASFMAEDSPVVTRAAAIARVTEELLDQIAAVGYSDLGMKGMLNQADVESLAGLNSAWFAGARTPAEILEDMNALVDRVPDVTSEVSTGTNMVMPIAAYRLVNRTIFQSNSPDTIMQVFQRQNPGVVVNTWTHAATAASDGRILVYQGGDKDVFDMFLPRPLTPTRPIPFARGYELGYFMKVGGVYSLYPQGAVYGDGILASS